MKHLKCCLCCEETFESKLAFAEHLTNVLANITCPVCNNKWSSLAHLIEHLNLDECQPDIGLNDNLPESDPHVENPCSLLKSYDVEDDNMDEPDLLEEKYAIADETSENNLVGDGKVYIEILEKDKANLPLPTQELKLVSENGEQFVIMSTGGANLNLENGVMTSQNSDGTISFETMSHIKTATTETVIAPSETEREDNQDELYSCNTCGVSFSSVLEHIQNYHNDQEVVVEEPLDEEDMGVKYDSYVTEDPLKQEGPKRVITDNGDIVDATVVDDGIIKDDINTATTNNEEGDKPKNQSGKRYVQIDKFCESVVKNINQQETGGPYHKVIVKNVIVSGETVKTYYCMSCNIYVGDLDDFKTQPCKTFKYPCPYCPVAYENSKSLCAHMKVHKVKTASIVQSTQSSESFECEICNTSFQTNKSLKLHKRMHDPIKSRPIEPPIEMPDGTEGSSGRYRCNVCEKLIPVGYRTIHQNSHKIDHKMNCGICNKKFLSAEYLEMHMSVHNLDKVPANKNDKSLPYCCLYCDRRFARPHEKVKHERIHTGEKPHSCEICGKSFRVAYCLTLHMRTHTGARPYACPLCNKRFKAHSVYNHHLLTHSAVRRYKCPFCPKAFKTSVQLAGHKNSHTKPFSCTHCNRPFASLYAVRVHTETHLRQNNLKFSCSLCGASYARAFALKDHVKQIHQQDVDTSTLNAASEQAQAKLKEQADWVVKENENEGEIITSEMNELDMTTDAL